MKYEWRKKEKSLYLPKDNPEIVDIPTFRFLSIRGSGNPNGKLFSEYISVLYAVSYAIKMTLKKDIKPDGYIDYTVYPLEGEWDITDEAKKVFQGKINKDDLVFKLMIRQPDFVKDDFVRKMIEITKKKKNHPLLDQLKFETLSEGKCVQMLHVGSYDNEQTSFAVMEAFASKNGLVRLSKVHREIYLSDFRKMAADQLKTVLRFKVKS